MRRIARAAVLIGGGMLAARALAPGLHERTMATCARMFDQMPDDFPPKRMMHGIEEIRASTARTLELLEEREQAEKAKPLGEVFPTRADEVETVHA